MFAKKIGIISTTTLILLTSEWITSTLAGKHDGVGYSYARFSGPVSGPEKEIIVHDKVHHKSSVDYVAKPDYSFAYGVEDPKSKVSQSRKEERHGDQLVGEYSVVDPNGVLRTVKYTADKHNGFQARIITTGGDKTEVTNHGNTGGSNGDGGHQSDNGHVEEEADDGGHSAQGQKAEEEENDDDSGDYEEHSDEDDGTSGHQQSQHSDEEEDDDEGSDEHDDDDE